MENNQNAVKPAKKEAVKPEHSNIVGITIKGIMHTLFGTRSSIREQIAELRESGC